MTAYTKLVRGRRRADGAGRLQRLPAAALGGPGGHDRRRSSPTRRACRTSTCCTCPRARRSTAAMRMADGLPARRLPPRGHRRPPARRHRRRRTGMGGKVNPPLRPRDDVEALWEHLLAGDSTGSSATTPAARTSRSSATRVTTSSPPSPASAARSTCCPGWSARAGGGVCRTSGSPQLTSWNPAAAVRAAGQGRPSRVGYDADFALVDPSATWTVHAEDSESTQEYTPVRGLRARCPRHRHLGAGRAGARPRQHRRLADRAVRAPAKQLRAVRAR